MKVRLSRATAAVATVAAATALITGAPASAVDDVKPEVCQDLKFIKDAAGDQAASSAAAQQIPIPPNDNTDILRVWLKHDPSKGAEATTFNIAVKDLAPALPQGSTSISWTVAYELPDGNKKFVRAVFDITDDLAFEYGNFTPTGAPVLTSVSEFKGETTGKLFEGPDGVVQIVVPQDLGGKGGTQLTEIYAFAGVGRTLPNATQTPSRGLSTQVDLAPDEGTVSLGVLECPAGGASTGTPVVQTPDVGTPQVPSGTPQQPSAGAPAVAGQPAAAPAGTAPPKKASCAAKARAKFKGSKNKKKLKKALKKCKKAKR